MSRLRALSDAPVLLPVLAALLTLGLALATWTTLTPFDEIGLVLAVVGLLATRHHPGTNPG
jgi:hypothetical protein